MKAIIIGAGRGSRLMPSTANAPKCLCQVGPHPILDWTLKAFKENGINDIVFIGGYQIDKVREKYRNFKFYHNDKWPGNNILASLMYAKTEMDTEFICCYSDVLFTPEFVGRMIASPEDMVLGVDIDWLARYEHRTEHPPDDAEKVTVANGCVTRVSRKISEQEAYGEYVGMARFSAAGASRLRASYRRCRQQFAGRPWRGAPVFEKAYKILLFQEMIEAGQRFVHVDTPGGYIEVDTQQDFEYAKKYWTSRHLGK